MTITTKEIAINIKERYQVILLREVDNLKSK
jgi:hypothetical protein